MINQIQKKGSMYKNPIVLFANLISFDPDFTSLQCKLILHLEHVRINAESTDSNPLQQATWLLRSYEHLFSMI